MLIETAERMVQARKILEKRLVLTQEEKAALSDPALDGMTIQLEIHCGAKLSTNLEFRDENELRRAAHPPRKPRIALDPGTVWAVRSREGTLLGGTVGDDGLFVAQEGRVFNRLPPEERTFQSESSACGKAYVLAGKKSYPARRPFRVLIAGRWRRTDR